MFKSVILFVRQLFCQHDYRLEPMWDRSNRMLDIDAMSTKLFCHRCGKTKSICLRKDTTMRHDHLDTVIRILITLAWISLSFLITLVLYLFFFA